MGYVKDLTMRAAAKAETLRTNAMKLATNPQAQVTAASAIVGAGTFGAVGGGVGLVGGGALGAAVGVPAALFTFGMSIPVCATVGAVVGGSTGATVGGTTGLVTGGAVGYHGYAHKEGIMDGAANAINTGKAKVAASTKFIRTRVGSAFARKNSQV